MSNPFERDELNYFIHDAVTNNKLIIIGITSSVEGMIESEGYKFGQGKSTFALWQSHNIYKKYQGLDDPWHLALENVGYDWPHIEQAVDRAHKSRVLSYVQDDAQIIVGKSRSRYKKVIEWAEWISTARPFFGVIWLTMPAIDSLARAWRQIIDFEVKIPNRGQFEIQQLKKRTNYKRPLDPFLRLKYFEDGEFPALPPPMEKIYVKWRKESSYASAPHQKASTRKTKERGTPIDVMHKRLNDLGYVVPRQIIRDVMAGQTTIPQPTT